eukprot:2185472-Alexandrium_andersonii.AAC.1
MSPCAFVCGVAPTARRTSTGSCRAHRAGSASRAGCSGSWSSAQRLREGGGQSASARMQEGERAAQVA